MATATAKIEIELEIIDPASPESIGQEAMDMATSFMRFHSGNWDRLAEIIRAGMKENFRTESEAGEPWDPLRPATLEEREALGFPYGSKFPMLVRRGEYRGSYIDAGSAYHIERVVEHGWQQADMDLEVGSRHPFAPVLADDAFSSRGNPVPPRRAHVLMDKFGDQLAEEVGRILFQMLREVRTIRTTSIL